VRVLVADDAPLARSILARLIVAAGHEVAAEAHDAPSLYERVATARPNLVIVDGRLPPSGALEAVRSLRAGGTDAPILVATAMGELDLLRAVLAAGASGGLPRPFLRSQVEEALRRYA
jgi:two-component system response regulator (stage 0 sporulation protein F)